MVKIGDNIPDAKLVIGSADGLAAASAADLFAGKKVVLFALPGAFTPTCSAKHVPGFLEHFEAFKAKGIDQLICLSVNDGFVMAAWAKDQGTGGKITMVGDGNIEFTKAMGLEIDASRGGMGVRSRRYGLYAEDGVIKVLNVEEPGQFEVSSAEAMLNAI